MNRKFGNILSAGLLAVFAGLVPNDIFGCGPYFQPHYLNGLSPYQTVLHRKLAVRRLIADMKDLIPTVPAISDGTLWKNAIEQDFTAAVDRYLPKLSPEAKRKLIRDYLAFMQYRWSTFTDFAKDFPKLPDELMEFTLYRAGIMELEPDGKEIPPSWKKLLELPRESRHFRTVWVYFMLGNYLKHDCGKYYQACRAAAREGFADTPGLVKASYKNEFRFTADRVRKIHVALELQRNRFDLELLAEEYNIAQPRSDAECAAMLADEQCREVLAIFGCKQKNFQQEVWKYKFRNADILAWRAYETGDVETAEKYLKLRTRDTLLSTYIEAKIARHHGNNELAIQKLRQWLKFVKQIDPGDRADIVEIKHVTDPFDTEPVYPLEQDVYGLLGSALVLRRDFAEAARFFYRAGQIEADVMYVAENYMHLPELTAFTDSVSDDLQSEDDEKRLNAQRIRHMTARRAFREGKFDIARQYLPEEYQGVLDSYLAFIRDGRALSKTSNERALSFYNAAKIMRLYGMELCGPQGAPDAFPYGQWGISADFEDCPDCKYDPKTNRWTLVCKKHQTDYGDKAGSSAETRKDDYYPNEKRIASVPRNQRFHYRYRAADLARQAADWAQDEDLRALANLFGGTCLRRRTPRKADVFYKRLVRESPNCAVAGIADKLRWFPDCPALKNEFARAEPCKTLDDVKKLMRTAAGELNEIMKKKAEELREQNQRKMIGAVKRNDLKDAAKYLSQGADVNGPDEKGLVPLHYAAVCQHVEMVKWLLAHGADVNKKNKREWTALHYALGSDDVTENLRPKGNPQKKIAAVRILVEAKANVNAGDDHGVTPVNLAIDDPDMLEYLMDHGGILSGGDAYRGQTLLHWAVVYNAPVKTVGLILKHGGKNDIDKYDGDGYAPLHRAVQAKNLQVVKLLVEHGANINLTVDEENKTALDLAEENNLHEIAKFLKEHGAARNRK